jgi:UMF1 family MFS transporter
MQNIPQNSRKVINAWCSYDIANSAYNLVITTAIFPIYYQSATQEIFKSDVIPFLGTSFRNTALYDFAVAAAYLAIVFITPLLSGIADLGGYRKRFMQFFTLIGSFSCMGLYWFNGANVGYGLLLVSLAVLGYAGSLVYYNSFLPIIATPDQHDRVSAKGFSWGYGGSLLLLIVNLVMIMFHDKFGLEKGQATRLSFLMVGIWWLGISQFAFWFLKEYPGEVTINKNALTKGFAEILKVFHTVRKQPVMDLFLLSFFFLSMGVQTIILVATPFGSTELGITGEKLIITIVIIQVLAIIGALLFGKLSIKRGNKFSLLSMLLIWISVCVSAYLIKTEIQFYILAGMVGLVLGGIQSQARSTYSKLIPEGTIDTASYFSFYDITEKLAIVLGMFGFGFIEQMSGSMRNSTLLLSLFFLVSFIILALTKFTKLKVS